jgi:predicted RNA-binding protein with PUA domain
VQEEALWAFFTASEAETVFCTRDLAMLLLLKRCGLCKGKVEELRL